MFPPRCYLIELEKLLKRRQIESVSLCATSIILETLPKEYEDIVKQIPEYILMEAAKGNITMKKKTQLQAKY